MDNLAKHMKNSSEIIMIFQNYTDLSTETKVKKNDIPRRDNIPVAILMLTVC